MSDTGIQRSPTTTGPGLPVVSLLLLGSGFCALVYQTIWFRAFRLVFGASTASTAAVLALFMVGLGLGSVWLGRRVDQTARPLWMYGVLELGIGLLAALSPLLVPVVRDAYAALGGSARLGLGLGTVVRLLLAAPVIVLPAVLMGGTLPAAARAVEAGLGRRRTGWLYGCNTLGAVLGVFWTSFWALEHLGMRTTCVLAAAANVAIALVAINLGKHRGATTSATASHHDAADTQHPPLGRRERALLGVAAATGFVFFLLEIVWYRLLGPLLGGSSYTFGLILALALLGIGLGGLLYGAGSARRPSMGLLAATLAVEGLVVLLPFAAGDQIALLALGVRTLAAAGFTQTIVAWLLVASTVVLLPALVAGYQFALLVGILGEGTQRLGREVGLAYGWNTGGAILGSLAGGFGLLPLVGAPELWRATGLALVLAGLALMLATGVARSVSTAVPVLAVALVAVLCAGATGPTAAWRHSGIGFGRFQGEATSPNEIRRAFDAARSAIAWQADGVESSVALHAAAGYAFFVNGKSDGHAIGDAATQVLSGLVGAAILEEVPRRALVVGLGTGSSAGWLGAIDEIERVDVVELEPAILEVARACTPVNHGVLENPKVHISIGDAREFLATDGPQYDVIFSEPSNPYRAGIASLFSVDFYQAVEQRLAPGGVLVQWLQGYEIDADTVRTVYATLGEVFPAIETWQVSRLDLLLVASREPLPRDFGRLAQRVEQEPWASALEATWGVGGLEGFLTGFIGDTTLARAAVATEPTPINTDDRSVLEFGFARSLGRHGLFSPDDLRELAAALPAAQTPAANQVDPNRVAELRSARLLFEGASDVAAPPGTDAGVATRHAARLAYRQGRIEEAAGLWLAQQEVPSTVYDRLLLGEGLARGGDDGALEVIAALLPDRPADAELLRARLLFTQDRPTEALEAWSRAIATLRVVPWVGPDLARREVDGLALDLARRDRELGRQAWHVLAEPLAVRAYDELRRLARLRLAALVDFAELCGDSVRDLEPTPPWDLPVLELRARCYEAVGDEERLALASHDLAQWRASEPRSLNRE